MIRLSRRVEFTLVLRKGGGGAGGAKCFGAERDGEAFAIENCIIDTPEMVFTTNWEYSVRLARLCERALSEAT